MKEDEHLRAMAEGCTAALEAVIAQYGGLVYSILLNFLGNAENAGAADQL